MFGDFFALIGDLLAEFFTLGRGMVWVSLIVGILFAALGWLACSKFSHGFHTGFQVKGWHHLMCALAAIITLFATILFFALRFTEPVVLAVIEKWSIECKDDGYFAGETFVLAYEEVSGLTKNDGTPLEDFTNYPHPDQGGNLFPTSKEESQVLASQIYAQETVGHFEQNHPLLSKILWADEEVSEALIRQDIKNFFAQNSREKPYPVESAINLAIGETKDKLRNQSPRIVKISRLICIVLFMMVQIIPFGSIAWVAYQDLKNGR